jgi:hypothetical protein
MAKSSAWGLEFAESRKASQKHLGHKLEILRPMIRVGHEFLRDCRNVCRTESDIVVAIAFRQCLEFADSVDLLLRHLMIAPAAAQARSVIENAAQVVFLLKKQDPVLAVVYLASFARQMEHELTRKKTAQGIDDEGRQAIQEELDRLAVTYQNAAHDGAGKDAVAEVRQLPQGRPWYSVRGGPANIHRLLEEIGLGGLSIHYSDLNPVVHGGMPLHSLGMMSGDPEDAESSEWLRPLRVPSPWSFRPLLATGVGLNIALVHMVPFFITRIPNAASRLATFAEEHNQRCERADMAVLRL